MPRRIINDIIAGRRAVTAEPDVTVRAASRLMAENRIGALLVAQGRRIVGIFTERDALNKVLAGGLDPDTTKLARSWSPIRRRSPVTSRWRTRCT